MENREWNRRATGIMAAELRVLQNETPFSLSKTTSSRDGKA